MNPTPTRQVPRLQPTGPTFTAPELSALHSALLTEPRTTAALREWAAGIQSGIEHADTKASILLGVAGGGWAVLAGVLPAALATFVGSDRVQVGLTVAGAGCAVAGLALLGAAVVALIRAVRPDLRGVPSAGSFIGAAHLQAGQIIDLALLADPDAGQRLITQVQRLADIATAKHLRVRKATTYLLAAFGPLAACALLLTLRAVLSGVGA